VRACVRGLTHCYIITRNGAAGLVEIKSCDQQYKQYCLLHTLTAFQPAILTTRFVIPIFEKY